MCNGVSTCRLSALVFHFSVQQCIRYVSEVYRNVSSVYLFQLVIILQFNSTPNRVSLCFNFQGFVLIPFHFSGFLFHERVRCMSFHFKWPLDKPMFRKVYHNTIIPMKMFFCVSTWVHFVSNFRVFVSWRFQNVFLWFILFPTRVSCTSWGKISHYHYTQSNSFLCSHLAHICSNIGGFVFCRSQNSFLVFSLFPK